MKRLAYILLFLFFTASLEAQISSQGFYSFEWGSKMKRVEYEMDCQKSMTSNYVTHCSFAWDKDFMDEFPVQASFMRFQKKRLDELSFDIDRKYMPYLIARLSLNYGSPELREFQKDDGKKESDRNYQITIYHWQVENTYIDIIDKGQHLPLWINVYDRSQQSAEKTYIFNPKP